MDTTIKSVSAEFIDDFILFEIDDEIAARFSQNIEQPHRHEFQEIIWVRHGTADNLLDGELIRVLDSSLHIVPKGRIHRGIPSCDLRGCCLRFNDEFLPNSSSILFSQFTGLSTIPLSTEDSGVIEAYLSLLVREAGHGAGGNRTSLMHLLRALIAKIEEFRLHLLETQPKNLTLSRRLWERFNVLIEQKFKYCHAVGDYARELGVSSRKLNETTTVFSGMTTSHLIDMRLILEAKRLMLFAGMPVKEVAFELGFNEHSYFTKVFKKLTGHTPSEFIKNSPPA